jgi:hypothetical protein
MAGLLLLKGHVCVPGLQEVQEYRLTILFAVTPGLCRDSEVTLTAKYLFADGQEPNLRRKLSSR